MTTQKLLHSLRAACCPPRVEGTELVLDTDPPEQLIPYIDLLQTGLRSVLTNQPWYGIDSRGHGCGIGFDDSLNPADQVPTTVVLFIVPGDKEWDRISSSARTVLKDAFCDPPEKPKRIASKRLTTTSKV